MNINLIHDCNKCEYQAYCDNMSTIAVHNVYFVKYDVTISFLAQVLDTVTYFVSQVLDTAS